MKRIAYLASKPHRSVWTIIGIALAAGVGVAGLLIVGAIVLLCVGLAHWSSNK